MVIVVEGRTFGDWLQLFRHDAEMTQQELATATGISRQSIMKWERGVRFPRNPDDVRCLAEALGLDDLQTEILCVTTGHSKRQAKEIEKEISSRSPISLPLPSKSKSESGRQIEQLDRLHALLSDSSFVRIHSLVNDFVGRNNELVEIRQQIDTILPKGGYLTITGLAGQGKSSIIAKLVEVYGLERTVYHFIPVNPPTDYEVHLLLDVMAGLILKYDLPTWYVADTSLPMLRNSFAMLLKQIATKGRQEVIFIDGLDQLKEDPDGKRDLSFLPNNPPEGFAFVLGTRPNDTLIPLELRKPLVIYELPRLSQSDFDALLSHCQVTLSSSLADKFYRLMQGNALFLSLAARALKDGATPEAISESIADDPEKVFGLSMDRLGRSRRDDKLWNHVIKPTLAILLVAQEPLAGLHIRRLIGVDADRFQRGVQRLRGLIVADSQQRYTLFHLKLRDYLRQDEKHPGKDYIFALDEEQVWHKRLAEWCQRGGIESQWQDVRSDPIEQERRVYARWHSITHLYEGQEWQRLFEVLDNGHYGQAKVRDGQSMRSYAQDLDLGRQAAILKGWTFEESITLLPRLWRYTLLRCSLTSRADKYPPAALQLLLLLDREQEALSLVELLTEPLQKVSALLKIARHFAEQPSRKPESIQVLMRICQVVRMSKGSEEKALALRELEETLVQAWQWEQAEAVWTETEAVVRTIEDTYERAKALRELGMALAELQQWERAEGVVRAIELSEQRAFTLCDLGIALVQAQQWERAEAVWTEAEAVVNMIEENSLKVWAMSELGTALWLIEERERAEAVWAEAEAVLNTIEENDERAWALKAFGTTLWEAEQWEQAETAWIEAEALMRTIEERYRARALRSLVTALAEARQWERAEAVASTIEVRWGNRDWALNELARALVEAQQWERAEAVASTITDSNQREWALRELVKSLAQSKQWEQAETIIGTMVSFQRDFALRALAEALAQEQRWEQAKAAVHMIEMSEERAKALSELGVASAQAEQREQAETLWAEIAAIASTGEESFKEARALGKLVLALAKEHQWELAETTLNIVEDSSEKDLILRELVVVLAQAQQWERAEAAVRMIEGSNERVNVLSKLGVALAQAQQWERAEAIWTEAEAVARIIGEEYPRIRAFSELGGALAQAQQWERAEAIWTEAEALVYTITDDNLKSLALGALWWALAEAQQWERAERTINLKQDWDRAASLRVLVSKLVQAQQWERAETVAHTIGDVSQRDEALKVFGIALAQAQQWERAETVAHTIEDESQRYKVLLALARVQQWERAKAVLAEAEVVVYTIEEAYERVRALSELGVAMARAQQWERAEAAWTEAETVAQITDEIEERDDTLGFLSKALMQVQQWERAWAILDKIRADYERAWVLNEIVEVLTANGEYDRLLRMVQRSWLEAERREHAAELLSLATELIPFKPETAAAFGEAFTWVDTFLKGC